MMAYLAKRIPGRDHGPVDRAKRPVEKVTSPVGDAARRLAATIRGLLERPQRQRAARRRKRGAAVAAAGVATGAGAYMSSSERRERLFSRVKGALGRSEPPEPVSGGPNGEVQGYNPAPETTTADTKA